MVYVPNSGSVVAFQANSSSLQSGASIIGLTPIQVPGSVAVAIISGPGSIVAFQGGGMSVSVLSSIPSSMLVGASIIGLTPVNIVGAPSVYGNISGSVVAFISGTPNVNTAGSVVAFQGGVPWAHTNVGSIISLNIGSIITVAQNSSILAVPVGSVITVLQAASIVGTYTEDAASAGGDKGILAFGVRNDTVSSLTSADLDYGTHTIDSAGRNVIKPFAPEEATFRYIGSIVSGSVTLVQASVIGKRSFITDFFFANTGSVSTLITFKDGSTSILGYTIAPSGGGSNAQGIAIPIKTATSQDLTFVAATSASVLYATIIGYQAP